MTEAVRSDGYYRWFPGDHSRDTADLSMTEDGAYRRLLDRAYTGEGLPSDRERLYRIAGATSQEDRKAVDFVVERFFEVVGGRLRQGRVERELTARRAYLEEQGRKAKMGADARWNARKVPEGMPGACPGGCPEGCPDDAPVSASGSGSRTSSEKEERSRESQSAAAKHSLRPASSADADLPSLWNRVCTSLPKCSKLTPKRKAWIKARLKEHSPDAWKGIFARIEASPFLTGQNDRGWKASFDWIIKSPDNAVKVLEGRYDSSGRQPGSGNPFPPGSEDHKGYEAAKETERRREEERDREQKRKRELRSISEFDRETIREKYARIGASVRAGEGGCPAHEAAPGIERPGAGVALAVAPGGNGSKPKISEELPVAVVDALEKVPPGIRASIESMAVMVRAGQMKNSSARATAEEALPQDLVDVLFPLVLSDAEPTERRVVS